MPIILREKFLDDCLFGIWEIRETVDNLLSQVQLYPAEKERLLGFKSNARRVEFLSVRVLLKELTGVSGPIVYSDKRKPYLHQSEYRISISHSQTLTAIMVSKTKKIGLDLEYMSHQIEKIGHRFINDDEYITSNPLKKKYHLYIHWCAKEALYKICDKQDINFKDNLTIETFQPMEKGVIRGRVHNRARNELFVMNYFSLGNYVVVYCCK